MPGLDEAGFQEAAEGAKANCPVSKALAGVPEITLDARSTASRAADSGAAASIGPWRPSTSSIDELERSYDEVQERMSDPSVYNDHSEAAEVGRRLKELEGAYKLAQEWRQARDDLEAARDDAELASWSPSSRPTSRGSRRS